MTSPPCATAPAPCAVAPRADAASLRIGGVVPFTTTDFPGRLAAVVFCQGCPWRCGYCHNPHLQEAHASAGSAALAWTDIEAWLDTRIGLLDGVVFSGGEPTAQPALRPAMQAVRSRGLDVALHTAGIYPRRLADIVELVDWVGLDIKAPLAAYADVTRIAGSGSVAFASLEVVQAAGIAFEVRTTVHADLTPARALLALAQALGDRGVAQWVLQPFRPTGCTDAALVAGAAATILTPRLIDALRAHVPDIVLR
jgi:anaerobic ribonucleoside-triphosphate reductase activating protein